ncbi:MAG: VWA domain-containing protein [Bacilli bacterium]|nr:VWA domain-containing protein [Bacilli bacterium]
MKLENRQKKSLSILFIIFICLFAFIYLLTNAGKNIINDITSDSFKILASSENKDIEKVITDYFKNKGQKVEIDYAGTIEIMDKLNSGENYDAIWASNSIWLYMLEDSSKITNSKSTSINPIVFGIKKSIAENLGFVDKEVYTKDILNAINEGKLKFVMTSATRTNTGASSYLGFLQTLAGNPEVLTEEHLQDPNLVTDITNLLNGVTRTSGSDEFLEDIMKKGSYDAAISYESSLINLNKTLEKQNKEPYYIVYPIDGVTISDSPLAYVNNKNESKEEIFLNFQSYILSKEGQKKLEEYGRRTWYGGINTKADKNTFKKEWGIDTAKYITPIKYPSSSIIKQSLALYQTEFRKPTHTVFCLDYSGSMYGQGNEQLVNAMNYILTEEEASKNLLQFSFKDKITVITFDDKIMNQFSTEKGTETSELIYRIQNEQVDGGTNLYDPLVKALKLLSTENSDEYNLSIVLMTDGEGNSGSFSNYKSQYKNLKEEIPIYAIMFGSAERRQLEQITRVANGKVFDGRSNLLEAFKEVRGYN